MHLVAAQPGLAEAPLAQKALSVQLIAVQVRNFLMEGCWRHMHAAGTMRQAMKISMTVALLKYEFTYSFTIHLFI